jgi:glycerol-3-phosphate acyltransferase PlsY
MTHAEWVGTIAIASYLLGSLPFGLWVAKGLKGVDIRQVGSGNIGATNVGRVCGPFAGGVVFTLDVLKGLLPPLVARLVGLESHWHVLMALLAMLGHTYSVFLKFKGGKGIATGLGAFLGTAPAVGGLALGIWVVLVLINRYVSLSSLMAAFAIPFLMLIFHKGDPYRLGFGIVAFLLTLYKHQANIKRLREGTEPKIKLPWVKP